ncbi:UDP-N-acetyl-D-galactosamine dehydrogenase [Aquimarina sp. MAR_2010_214]|uniref:nucleotide sugar dehydrogenase n=1 Tax=Aquimarina sp. MAR_2010_214 TaxID=1250026 RepID=UPI000C70DDAB|nr:nucleotide sugar dehydrogenase [Aquimarina sp. MAR_2010_214]PKV48772.1 UDP-N-acetyl-D-galactosamine dehydrogenase [Aquimarina sp. MAR_2010_214]
MKKTNIKDNKIAIIGLGYVGLPLAVEFSKNDFNVIGYDINSLRIENLCKGIDFTNEVSEDDLKELKSIHYTSDKKEIQVANIYIVTVPTPIDEFKQPDLNPLKEASKLVGRYLSKGDLVIFESTVFPGCTEEVCVPILEEYSDFKFNVDFFCGYSPERINPGDKVRRVHNIVKITSGSNERIAEVVDQLYSTIVTVGTHKASSIKVAEAAKIIENTQRDLNISFVNELALIFDKMNIDTLEVLEAAGTKWNFLPFRPGLVGGHCIGVDPFYLTHKAESLGYHPQVILSGRKINDEMGVHIANKVIKLMVKEGLRVKNAKALILGITFKENCPDIRNSKVIDVINELKEFGVEVEIYDPHADRKEVKKEYDVDLINEPKRKYDTIILTVGHDEFKKLNIKELGNTNVVIYDVKSFFPKELVTDRL